MFVGREREIEQLLSYLNRPTQENIVIYGRRRIGKSFLIKETLRRYQKPFIFYQAKETTLEDNLQSLSALVCDYYHLGEVRFASIEAILNFLFSKNDGMVIVIDEYPYLRDLVPGLDSIVQKLIDTYQPHASLKLILLGSYIEVMGKLNERDNPLYGRISLMMFITKMDYYEASLFYPDVDTEAKIQYYSVFDGVPYYNSLINPKESFTKNLERIVLGPNSQLGDFIEHTLSKELRKINGANVVFSAIAQGITKFNDILSHLPNSTSSALSAILNNLIKMDLIKKVTPINEPPHSRRTYYEINDNYIAFYYRYLYTHNSARQLLSPAMFYQELIEKDFHEQYVPRIFEKIAGEYLIRENQAGRISPPLIKLGKYWYDNPSDKVNGEFDLVGEDRHGYIIYEVKYTKRKIGPQVVNHLITQLEKGQVKNYRLGFFSKSGFDLEQKDDYYLRTLEEVYSLSK